MVYPTEPSPPSLTYGVELEFAILYLFDEPGSRGGKPSKPWFSDGLPEPLRVPSPIKPHIIDLCWVGQNAVEAAVRKVLTNAGFPTDALKVNTSSDTIAAQRLDKYRVWDVDEDATVNVINLPNQRTPVPLRFASMEIGTPVDCSNPKSFEVVRFAVNLLASKFRIVINPSMGLHVHIGNGPSWMPYPWIKRMAMLFWAADRLLATLNPPTRRYNYYCPGIREYSVLAKQEQDDEFWLPRHELASRQRPKCYPYIATDVRVGECDVLWRETHTRNDTIKAFLKTRESGHYEPFFEEDARKTLCKDAAEPDDPREPIDNYTYENKPPLSNDSSGRSSPEPIDNTLKPPLPKQSQKQIASRVASVPPRGEIEQILDLRPRLNPFRRCKLPDRTDEERSKFGMVNEKYTGCDNEGADDPVDDPPGVWYGVQNIAETKASCEIAALLTCYLRANYNFNDYSCRYIGWPGTDTKRTVEWRQGAGSMDALWVSTWARIVVGVSRAAVHIPPSEFLRLLRCCDYAENGGEYDVLDLLEDLGLVAEAKIAGQRIQAHGGEWGTEFV